MLFAFFTTAFTFFDVEDKGLYNTVQKSSATPHFLVSFLSLYLLMMICNK